MQDKVVVITGGSKGLGKALAQVLSKNNKVIICARQELELEKTAREIEATAFVADVTKENEVQKLGKFAVSTFGKIDIWINNAGVWLPHTPVVEIDFKRVHKMFEVNVFGTMYGSKVALLQMRTQKEGLLINIISTSGLTARPTASGYAASKWAARGFTDSIREECRGTNIHVIGVYPGGMQTAFFDEEKPQDVLGYGSQKVYCATYIAKNTTEA